MCPLDKSGLSWSMPSLTLWDDHFFSAYLTREHKLLLDQQNIIYEQQSMILVGCSHTVIQLGFPYNILHSRCEQREINMLFFSHCSKFSLLLLLVGFYRITRSITVYLYRFSYPSELNYYLNTFCFYFHFILRLIQCSGPGQKFLFIYLCEVQF